MRLVEEIYHVTKTLPLSERDGLISQIQRAAVSIPSNIVEAKYRITKKDNNQFLRFAFGSCAEVEAQLCIIERLFGVTASTQRAQQIVTEILKMLNVMLRYKSG